MQFKPRRFAAIWIIAGLTVISLSGTFASAQVASIGLGSTNSVGPLNWADGTWYMRAVQLDGSDVPVGAITGQLSFTLSSEYPNIAVTMAVSAPAGNKIRFYRNLGSGFNVGDPNIEYYDQTCPTGSVCDSGSVNNIALVNTLGWVTGPVVPVELVSFAVE